MISRLIAQCVAVVFLISSPLTLFADEAKVKQAIKEVFNGVGVTRIQESKLPGIYEVLVGTDVIYASGDGRYVLRGDLIDMQNRVNLSEKQRTVVRSEIINAIPLAETVTFAAKNKKHEVYIFTDITCGYCRKLHADVNELNALGIDVHYLAFPRAGIGSQPYRDMESVWCSQDKNAAMTQAKAGGTVKAEKCANPVKAQYELGGTLGVRGTPAIYFKDGRSLPGYVPPKVLLEELNKS